jgi:hypothetical protein
MAESFLKEQLKRIRDMTERMARVHDHTAELSHELERDPESAIPHGPLAEVRDFRPYSAPSYEKRDRSEDRSERRRRPVARDSSRRPRR